MTTRSWPDDATRRRAIEDLWASDGVEHTDADQYRGDDAIAGRVTAAYQ